VCNAVLCDGAPRPLLAYVRSESVAKRWREEQYSYKKDEIPKTASLHNQVIALATETAHTDWKVELVDCELNRNTRGSSSTLSPAMHS
jgi:hypothetical protein